MRTVQWLFVVSVALFISGIAFIIAGARTARAAPAAAEEVVDLKPVASVRHIMNGIVAPAAGVVYGAVATTISREGIVEKAPQNDAEWAQVADSAAALAEAGNLLMMSGRAIDNADWTKIAGDLVSTADMALKAAEAKDKDAIVLAGGPINDTCDACHAKYQRQ
jgi:hypothetical protein